MAKRLRSEPAASEKRIDFSALEIDKAVIEVRYEEALAIWDKAGAIWSEIRRQHPNLEISDANPGRVQGRIADQFSLSVQLDKAVVATYQPSSSLVDFAQLADSIFTIVCNEADIVDYTRVGLRLFYAQDFKSRLEAASAVRASGLIQLPTPPYFGIDGSLQDLELVFKHEGGAAGVNVRIRNESRNIALRPPPEAWRAGFRPQKGDMHLLIYDVDYYTAKPVSVSQLSLRDWVPHALHLIRRDSPKILAKPPPSS